MKTHTELHTELQAIFHARLARLLARLEADLSPDQELSTRALLDRFGVDGKRGIWKDLAPPGSWAAIAPQHSLVCANALRERLPAGPPDAANVGEVLAKLRQRIGAMAERTAADLAERVAALGLPGEEASALALLACQDEGKRAVPPPFLTSSDIDTAEGALLLLLRWATAMNGRIYPPAWPWPSPAIPASTEDTRAWLARCAPDRLAREDDATRRVWQMAPAAPGLPLPVIWQILRSAWLELHPEEQAWRAMGEACTPTEQRDPPLMLQAVAAKLAGTGDEHREARRALADELLRTLQAFQREHMAGPPEEPKELKDAPGRLWLDELAAGCLAPMGKVGEKGAQAIREAAAERWTAAHGPIVPGVDRPPPAALWRRWLPVEGKPAFPFARNLARCLWARMEAERKKAKEEERKRAEQEREERKRAERLLAPAVPAFLARTIIGAGVATMAQIDKDGALELTDGDWRQRTPAILKVAIPGAGAVPAGPAALEVVARGVLTEDGARMTEGARRALPAVVAHLVRGAWSRLRAGEPRFDLVPMPVAQNVVRKAWGLELSEDEIDAALEWLCGWKVRGFSAVAGYHAELVKPHGGGRPSINRIVHVGLPLAPMGIERVFKQCGIALPAELRWYAPVLSASHAPLTGNRRTHERQRTAFSLGIGTALVALREEYAGPGIRMDDLRRPLRELGLYHRTHASLIDDVLIAWCTPPKNRSLLPDMPTGALLEEVNPQRRPKDDARYRLGKDYADADTMLRGAAEETAKGRAKQEKGAKPNEPTKRKNKRK